MIYAREIIPHIHFFMFKINNNLKNNLFLYYINKFIYIHIIDLKKKFKKS